MKKDRNCNAGIPPYPIYPSYNPGMMMPSTGMIPNQPMINPNSFGTTNMMENNYPQINNTLEQQVYNLNNQISSLEKRVLNLENLVGNNNTQYNTSNYQVM